jgi:hypothetical protein
LSIDISRLSIIRQLLLELLILLLRTSDRVLHGLRRPGLSHRLRHLPLAGASLLPSTIA